MTIGSDFGPSKSIVAAMRGGRPQVLADRAGHEYTPSVVMVAPADGIHVGRAAVDHPARYAGQTHTLSSIKRQLGRSDQVQWGDLRTYPQEISALILRRLCAQAEMGGVPVERAVIAVPAHYDLNQRWATIQAAEIAGFSAARLVNEATAAAVAYSWLRHRAAGTVLVYDLGGGTLDVSRVEWSSGVVEVIAASGDGLLGGDDIDQCIIDWLAAGFAAERGIDLRQDPVALRRLGEAAAQAKVRLSTAQQVDIELPYIVATPAPAHLNVMLTRARLQELVAHLGDRLIAPCERVLADGARAAGQIDEVILIGGATRMPWVQQQINAFFDARLGHSTVRMMMRDDLVALGAALLADVLDGGKRDLLLLDVAPQTLGLELAEGRVAPLIPRNTTIPTRRSAFFSTTADSQTEARLRIYEGEGPTAAENKLLGTVVLSGIHPAPQGQAQIGVIFDVDAGGFLHVSATDKASGHRVAALIEAPYRLNPAQVGVLRRQVSAALAPAEQQDAQSREAELDQAARERALGLKARVEAFLDRAQVNATPATVALLASASGLIDDYLARDAAREALDRLIEGIVQTYDEAVAAWMEARLRAAAASPAMSAWAAGPAPVWERPDDLRAALQMLRAVLQAEAPGLAELAGAESGAAAQKTAGVLAARVADSLPVLVCLRALLRGSPEEMADLPAAGLDGAAGRRLRLVYLADTLRRGASPALRAQAARELAALLAGSDCVFLARYLAGENDAGVAHRLEEGLQRLPPAAWLRWLQHGTDADRREIEQCPAVRRMAVQALLRAVADGETADRQSALTWLERWGIEEHLPHALAVLAADLDVETRCRLIELIASTKKQEAIVPLFQALADPHESVIRASLGGLEGYREALSAEQQQLLDLARGVLLAGGALRPRDRRLLRKIGADPALRGLARWLERPGDTRPRRK
jgi:molecular chaperone DnaK